MLRIRLSRVGKKKQPSYRIVVADSRSPRDGAHVKIIGHYNPRTDPATLVVKEDEAIHWLQKGAQPSDTVAKLLTRIGVMEKAGRKPFIYKGPDVPPRKKAKDGEEPAEAAAPGTEAKSAEPAAEEPAAKEPAAKAPAEEPAAEEPAAKAPAEEPAAEEPTADAPAEEPAAEEPTADAPAEEPTTEESTADESADKPAAADASEGADDAKEAKDKTAPTE